MKNKKQILIFLFCLLISTSILLICSQNSPLYPMNTWVDVNAFFTVGKGMINGLIPYKDLFEQKGPVLYLIYGIGYLITNHSFLGVFIIEVIFNSIFLFYCYKIIKLFINEKYAFIILPALLTIIGISGSFSHGGSAEEFCFCFLAISLYHLLNYFINQQLNSKIIFINGFIAGIVFLIKYNICGFWFSFMMFIFFDLLISKQLKKGIKYCFIFLIGMIIPFTLFSIYFLLNNAFMDFIDCYFIINITMYGNTSGNIILKITNALNIFFNNILNRNGILIFLLFIGIIFFIDHCINKNKYKIYLYLTVLISIIITFIGGVGYLYYSLIWFVFIIFTLIEIARVFDKILPDIKNKNIYHIICILFIITSIIISYEGANYKNELFEKKENLIQYQYAEIINKDTDKSLLNYGFLDLGLYFTTNQNPTIKNFELQNINYNRYPDNLDGQYECINNKCVNYIVVVMKKGNETIENKYSDVLKNYDIVDVKSGYQDYVLKDFYLLKRR